MFSSSSSSKSLSPSTFSNTTKYLTFLGYNVALMGAVGTVVWFALENETVNQTVNQLKENVVSIIDSMYQLTPFGKKTLKDDIKVGDIERKEKTEENENPETKNQPSKEEIVFSITTPLNPDDQFSEIPSQEEKDEIKKVEESFEAVSILSSNPTENSVVSNPTEEIIDRSTIEPIVSIPSSLPLATSSSPAFTSLQECFRLKGDGKITYILFEQEIPLSKFYTRELLKSIEDEWNGYISNIPLQSDDSADRGAPIHSVSPLDDATKTCLAVINTTFETLLSFDGGDYYAKVRQYRDDPTHHANHHLLVVCNIDNFFNDDPSKKDKTLDWYAEKLTGHDDNVFIILGKNKCYFTDRFTVQPQEIDLDAEIVIRAEKNNNKNYVLDI